MILRVFFFFKKKAICNTLIQPPWKNTWVGDFFFFKLGFTPCKAEQPLTRHGVTRKKAQKRLQDTENLFRKNLQLKDVWDPFSFLFKPKFNPDFNKII